MQIEIQHISKAYRSRQVLQDVSLCAHGGMCVGILGSNGSGKSTLLSILAGIQKPDAGIFLYNGTDLFRNPAQRSALVGYVPQGTPLIEELTAWDNLRLWYRRQELRQELDGGILSMLGVGEFLKTPVSKLSGGMKKRLSIGCAMANRPPIALLDEPTAALDLPCKERIAHYLRQYRSAGGLVLLTTHDIQELALCDVLYIIKNGVLTPFSYDGDVGKLVNSL